MTGRKYDPDTDDEAKKLMMHILRTKKMGAAIDDFMKDKQLDAKTAREEAA